MEDRGGDMGQEAASPVSSISSSSSANVFPGDGYVDLVGAQGHGLASSPRGTLEGWTDNDSEMELSYVQVEKEEEALVVMEGWLQKQSFYLIDGQANWRRHFVRWKRRYFVLTGDGVLKYHLDEQKTEPARFVTSLANWEVTAHSYANQSTEQDGRCFILRPRKKSFGGRWRGGAVASETREEELKVLASSPEEMQAWMSAISRQIEAIDRREEDVFQEVWRRLGTLIYHQSPTPPEEVEEPFIHVDAGKKDAIRRPVPPTELSLSDLACATPTIPIPRMSIVIMVVGTRGDVQPFTVVGQLLQKSGHRVRLATHELYRDQVMECGLEFYPLEGDPTKLSAFMVKRSGRIFPKLYDKEEMLKDLPEQFGMIREIIHSTWPACTAPDPKDPSSRPFIADAIISNPVTYGHFHCAEALSVPLHIMFPQPWSPTKAFPHPLSGLPYNGRWCKENYLSYLFVDKWLWFGTREIINDFRVRVLGLDPIRFGEHGGDILNHNKVPFAKMWSPSLTPKPKDWGPHIDIVGNVFSDLETVLKGYEPPLDLVAWFDKGDAPIFVGFGSMVIEDTASLVDLVVGAALQTGTRVVLQSSWAELKGENLPSNIFLLGNCPHDWLMPRMAAVIHHGGAGTVAAGLRAGKPTMVCPFFGDQYFWGYMVHKAGVGVKPVPVAQLTRDKLVEAFRELRSERLVRAAQAIGFEFSREDGAREAVKVFYKHLPLEDMVCDVSLFTGKPRVARTYCETCGLKLSFEADAVIHTGDKEGHVTHEYRFVDWGVAAPQHAADGLYQGITSATHEVIQALTGFVTEPVVGATRMGVRGAVSGLGKGLYNLVRRPIRGGVIFFDKVSAGVSKQWPQLAVVGGVGLVGYEGDRDDATAAHPPGMSFRRYLLSDRILDFHRQLFHNLIHGDCTTNRDTLTDRRKHLVEILPPGYEKELLEGFAKARRCSKFFLEISKGNSSYIPNACVLDIMESMGEGLQDERSRVLSKELLARLDTAGDGQISFQQFCIFFRSLDRLESTVRLDPSSREAAQALDEIFLDFFHPLDSVILLGDEVFLEDNKVTPTPTPLPPQSAAVPPFPCRLTLP